MQNHNSLTESGVHNGYADEDGDGNGHGGMHDTSTLLRYYINCG